MSLHYPLPPAYAFKTLEEKLGKFEVEEAYAVEGTADPLKPRRTNLKEEITSILDNPQSYGDLNLHVKWKQETKDRRVYLWHHTIDPFSIEVHEYEFDHDLWSTIHQFVTTLRDNNIPYNLTYGSNFLFRKMLRGQL